MVTSLAADEAAAAQYRVVKSLATDWAFFPNYNLDIFYPTVDKWRENSQTHVLQLHLGIREGLD